MNKSRKSASAAKAGAKSRRPMHLDALRELVEPGFPDATELFEKGLKLLVSQLMVDRAVIVRITDLGYETLWWATLDGSDLDLSTFDPNKNFCPQVLEHSPRTLVIRDAKEDTDLKSHSAFQDMAVRSYIGVPLRKGDKVIGVLCVQSSTPQKYTRADIVFVSMVANLLGSAMEIELLKQELHMTREALDLTMSVVEDSALEAQATRLPSRRYLDIWLKAYLYMARRRSEPMALVSWKTPLNRDTRKALREISDQARGEDLLVDMGKEVFLLLLPRTSLDGAEFLVQRVRAKFGPVPVGTALWDPADPADRDDFTIREALRRAMEGLNPAPGALA
ncbi:MAG: GAF domain-containing protein [Holophaga sp.]|nr:GAF domain-containing protein [Holophaga sp.]